MLMLRAMVLFLCLRPAAAKSRRSNFQRSAEDDARRAAGNTFQPLAPCWSWKSSDETHQPSVAPCSQHRNDTVSKLFSSMRSSTPSLLWSWNALRRRTHILRGLPRARVIYQVIQVEVNGATAGAKSKPNNQNWSADRRRVLFPSHL